ncbi:MAG: hypothetical protein ACU836_06140 [Gammaproteobacteria bacterium]
MLLLIIATLLYVNWRDKRKHHQQLERLLDDIQSQQATRGDKLIQRLEKGYDFNASKARNLSKQLIVLEKEFLRGFIQQQVHQQPIEYFYQKLCKLLDNYLKELLDSALEIPKEYETTQPASGLDKHDIAKFETDDRDWGDVFD